MAVSADQSVGIGDRLAALVGAGPHDLRDVLQIDLVADARPWWDDLEIVERLAAPLEEFVAFAVAVIFELDVFLERARIAELVDHHAVIDDEVDGYERIDFLRIAAEAAHGIAHRGEIDDRRNAGEVLHQHPGRSILDLAIDAALFRQSAIA